MAQSDVTSFIPGNLLHHTFLVGPMVEPLDEAMCKFSLKAGVRDSAKACRKHRRTICVEYESVVPKSFMVCT